jgi:MFS family permease
MKNSAEIAPPAPVAADSSNEDLAPEHQGELSARRILRKIDLHLLPLIVGLHAISLVDRTNISVARISGMDKDLDLDVGERVSIVTSTFFIGYILFNIPSNVVIRMVGAARFLGTITVAWGLVTVVIGVVDSWVAVAVLRSLLGIFEAGYVASPGIGSAFPDNW